MPELPEVESIRLSLLPHLIGRTVLCAQALRRDIVIAPDDPQGGFSRQRRRPRPAPLTARDLLEGSTITALERRGKQLAIIAGDRALVVQLGMTGGLRMHGADDKHIHARWVLGGTGILPVSEPDHGQDARATELVFHDPRRFGAIRVFRSLGALRAHWAALGPDALTLTPAQLRAALSGSRRPIKAALLDQETIAGVGNIYADEALYLSGIRPTTPAHRIPPSALVRLAAAIRRVLAESIRSGGTTLSDYADAEGREGGYVRRLRVYGRAGLPCRRCRQPLSTGRAAQRTTVWCARCQPARL